MCIEFGLGAEQDTNFPADMIEKALKQKMVSTRNPKEPDLSDLFVTSSNAAHLTGERGRGGGARDPLAACGPRPAVRLRRN
jgi:hypothetical protein